MGLLEAWRRREAARQYASTLLGYLARSYGRSATYTAGQISAAIKALRLDPGFIALALAAFQSEADYEAQRAALFRPLPYKTARRAFLREVPGRPSSAAWDNAASRDAYVDGEVADAGGEHP